MSKKKKRLQKARKNVVYRPLIVKAVNFDATRDASGIKNHWAYTDSSSMDASLSADVRQTLRERARYEIWNNSYAYGICLTIANHVIGNGPRLQVIDHDESGKQSEFAQEMEWAFESWANEIKLAQKLRAMRFSRFQDGETFAILYNNPNLFGEIKLDIAPIDCERVQAGNAISDNPLDIDGVIIDEWGNPVKYRVLNQHPGSATSTGDDSATEYEAKFVVHWFRKATSEQHRGVTELASCLNLFALLRRYTESVVTAAETAADLAMVFSTDSVEDTTSYQYGKTESSTGSESVEFPEIQFKKGMSLTLPTGWTASQIRAEQPTTTYSDFKRELLGEIGRSLQIPVNIVTGDSSRHNYASGRLDHQEFQKQIRLDQSSCRTDVMTPIFNAWWEEYAKIAHKNVEERPQVQWYFDGFEHVDPVKEATAQQIKLTNGSTNLMIECGKAGYDWEEVVAQRAKEVEMLKATGLADFDMGNISRKMVDTDSDGNPTR